MIMPLSANKLRNEHLTRPALVYVRQSTLAQLPRFGPKPVGFHLA